MRASTRERVAMRAIQIASLDGPQAAKVVEIDEPAADGAVLVDVHAAGVAFPDALQSRGLYQYKPEMPYTPGAEIAGVVRSAPDGAHVAAGDRVLRPDDAVRRDGRSRCAAIPIGCSSCPTRCRSRRARDCCSTTSRCITRCARAGRLADGETVLVHGAAGGIGTSTLRLAPGVGRGPHHRGGQHRGQDRGRQGGGCLRRGAGRRLQGRGQGTDRRSRRGHRRRPRRR